MPKHLITLNVCLDRLLFFSINYSSLIFSWLNICVNFIPDKFSDKKVFKSETQALSFLKNVLTILEKTNDETNTINTTLIIEKDKDGEI